MAQVVETQNGGIAGTVGEAHVSEVTEKKKKKKKRKYSTGLGYQQDSIRALNKAAKSIYEGVTAGIKEWDRQWDKSARKKRNGGLLDSPRNFGRAASKALRVATKGPSRATKALPKIKRISLSTVFVPPLWFSR